MPARSRKSYTDADVSLRSRLAIGSPRSSAAVVMSRGSVAAWWTPVSGEPPNEPAINLAPERSEAWTLASVNGAGLLPLSKPR